MMKYIFVLFVLGQTFLFAISDKALGITIDLSGKQRMLTQRMAKESLLILLGNMPKENKEKLSKDIKLFDKTLKGLVSGDVDLKLESVQDKAIQKQLKLISGLFAPFKKSVEAIINGNANDDDYFQAVLKPNMKLLKEMNKAVYMYTALSKGTENKKLKMANNINLAGKQRMLTQRMAKDLLVISMASPKDRLPSEKDFNSSRDLFDRTIKGLISGDQKLKLQKTELPNIRFQLEKVQQLWKIKQETFKKAFSDKKQLFKAVSILDKLMLEMNTAVKLYTQSIVRQKQRNRVSSIVSEFMEEKDAMRALVNISGKQRMLTQRISKLSLQCALGLEREKSCNDIGKYRREYTRALLLFVKGDESKGVSPTKDKKILGQIKKLISLWKPFEKAAKKLSKANGKDKKSLLFVLKNEHTLLAESDKLVKLYEKGGRDQSTLQKARLRVVNIAGRERMLTQKMSKEKLLWQKLNSKKQKDKMFQTIKLFEKSLYGLLRGDSEQGLPKVANKKIIAQLKLVYKTWKKIKPFYIKEKLTQKELKILVRVNPILLKEMHKAVGLMEKEVEY